MTTQVVNLLHLRSLASGEIPVNMEFGQFAVNVYNVENPTLTTLRDASFFIGTGGNERVDEDGTDRSADVAIASGFTGEAVQLNKGWVRYQLRKVKVTGDTMVGDLTMSGASIRFQPGISPEAQLVLPTDTVSITGESGAIRYNATIGALQFHNGTTWITVGGIDSQVVSTVPPTTRSDTTPLAAGDLWFDPVIDTQFVYDGTGWQKVIGSPGDYQIQATAPTLRTSGDPLVPGDQWFDTTVNILKLWDGAAWFDVVQSPNFQNSATVPTLRSTGGALVAGDTYYNTTSGSYFVWDGTVWRGVDTFTDFQTRTGVVPTLRDDNVDALVEGDWWYDNSATVPFLYFWDGAQWVNSTDGGVF